MHGDGNDHGAGSRLNGSDKGSGGGDINGSDIGSGGGDGVTTLSVASSFPELKLLNFATFVSRKGGTAENPGLAPTGRF